MAKINISMDDDLLTKVDEMAKALYTNRSAYISMTLAQVIKTQMDAMGLLQSIASESIKDQKNNIETKKQMKE